MKFDPDTSGILSVKVEAESASADALADAIFADSQRYVPVLSGDLKRSGRIERGGDATRYVVYGEGLPDIRATAQEFGTSKMDAQPYLRPAALKVRDL